MSHFEILDNNIRKKIILRFLEAKKNVSYDELKSLIQDETSRPDYHLNLLVENDFIKRIKGRGNYILNEKKIQPLRDEFEIKVPVCLIGGLGTELSLYVDILDALQQLSILPKKYILLTSPEIKAKYNELNYNENYPIKTILQEFDYQAILREKYPKIYNVLETFIKNEIHDFEVICELTGSTKPVSIALMVLGEQYGLQRIYFSGKKIIWI